MIRKPGSDRALSFWDRVTQAGSLGLILGGVLVASTAKQLNRAKRTHATRLPQRTLPQRLRPWWWVWRNAAEGWSSHKAAKLGAALAYYSMFSIGPLLLVAITVAGLVFGDDAARGAVRSQLSGLLGQAGAEGVQTMLAGAGKTSEGLFAAALGLFTLLFGAVGVVVQLKDALNIVFDLEKKAISGIWGYVRMYAVSLAGVVSVGFLLLVSLLVSTVLAAAGTAMAGYFSEVVLQMTSTAVSFFVTTGLFAAIYRWLPDEPRQWRDIFPAALLTAALFNIGRLVISFYIGQQGLESTYGAAASLVVVLIWVYYSSQIVLFGAEFVRAHENARERNPKPTEAASIGESA